MLKIYRSSAGAGKTHALVLEYLKLALRYPEACHHILAITFTNRATQEMKQRILVSLHKLACGIATPIRLALSRDTDWNSHALQHRAQATLANILHKYDHFSVCTIDSFFQKIIRSFIHELNLKSDFSLVLDPKHALSTIVDELMASAHQYPELQHWLLTSAERKLLAGQSWYPKQELLTWGKALFIASSEASMKYVDKAQHEKLPKLFTLVTDRIYHFESHLRDLGQRSLAVIQRMGLTVNDLAYGYAGAAGWLAKLAAQGRGRPSIRVKRVLNDVNAWFSKASSHRALLPEVQQLLHPYLQAAVQFYDQYHRVYYTACEMEKAMYSTYLPMHLLSYLQAYREQHNVLFLSDITYLLHQIIGQNEVPFVYEKAGTTYQHFLIDEFQDISRIQWENLQPLITNSLHAGHTSLVVGDVKQSIYRWRGGDWKLLLTQLEESIPSTISKKLSNNWRSKKNIIDFNNYFFECAAEILTVHLRNTLPPLGSSTMKTVLEEDIDQLHTMYKDVAQDQPKSCQRKDEGHVHISFIEENTPELVHKNWREVVQARIPQLLASLQYDGYALHDIAILTRNNAEGRLIFSDLTAYQQSQKANDNRKYAVISKETLCLAHNPWVNLLIHAITHLVDPANIIAQVTLSYLYQTYVLNKPIHQSSICFQPKQTDSTSLLPSLFTQRKIYLSQLELPELVEALISIFQLRNKNCTAFVQGFQDLIAAFMVEQRTTDPVLFLAWWDMEGAKRTLPQSSQQDAVTLMTMHQAKGLQFKVVIIPFCDWDLDHGAHHAPHLWLTTKQAPFTACPKIPLKYAKSLQDTLYAQDYYQERIKIHLDHLNLLYVAFTRPEDRLYVFAPHTLKDQMKRVSDLLYQTLRKTPSGRATSTKWKKAWDVHFHQFNL